MKETLSSIAGRLGVSTSTVSRVLSGTWTQHRIPRDTAERIIAEAERCHYSPSQTAKSLRTRKTATIGVVLPAMNNPFFSEVAGVIISEANHRGYTTVLIDTMEDEDNQKSSLLTMLSRQVEGIIIAPCGGEDEILSIVRAGTPVVLIDRYYEDGSLSYVTTNNHKGGIIATRALLDYGHTRIACIQGVETSMPNRERVKGYIEEMKAAGLEDNIRVVGREFSIQNGYLETRMLLNSDNPPTAIFSLSNTIGLGAMKAIHEMGLRIPEDISLISFDNNLYLDYMTPPITRVSQPVEDMARLATKILFEKIAGEERTSTIMLSPNLISGGSIKAVVSR